MTEIELRPRQTGALIDATITVVRNRFGPMVMASLIFVVPNIVFLLLSLETIAFLLLQIASLLLLPIAFGATIFLAAGAYVGVDPDWRAAVGFAWKEYLHLLISPILAWVAIFFVIVIGLVPLTITSVLTLTGESLTSPAGSTEVFVIVISVVIAFFSLILGIFLLISFALTLEAIMLEGKGAISGLGRSWRLVKGHRGRIFLVGFLFVLLVGLVLVIPGGIISVIGPFALAVWNGLTPLVTIPLTSALGVAIYFNLRVRKENLDAQADEIDQIRMRLGAGPA